ncbi:MAG: hypothetical protein M1833_004508 [Piccolia ochrophora]|nr:MAG: hypothetical protein M1833_004508 [Piccolia ochrophora]
MTSVGPGQPPMKWDTDEPNHRKFDNSALTSCRKSRRRDICKPRYPQSLTELFPELGDNAAKITVPRGAFEPGNDKIPKQSIRGATIARIGGKVTKSPVLTTRAAGPIEAAAVLGTRTALATKDVRKRGQTQNAARGYNAIPITQFTGWTKVEAVGFMIEYNDGYAMTIPDMAKAFTVVRIEGEAPQDGVKALIYCYNPPDLPKPKDQPVSLVRKKHREPTCREPELVLLSDKIVLPFLNKPASQVNTKASEGGGCATFPHSAEGTYRSFMDVQDIGTPAFVACGISPHLVENDHEQEELGNFPKALKNMRSLSTETLYSSDQTAKKEDTGTEATEETPEDIPEGDSEGYNDETYSAAEHSTSAKRCTSSVPPVEVIRASGAMG